MGKGIHAGEHRILDVLSREYSFTIPDYQRPYSWQPEQAMQLLQDLSDHMQRDSGEPYFLGSIVLIKDDLQPESDVIDGQQRLTTLTILLAILRDMSDDPELKNDFQSLLMEEKNRWARTAARPRLTLRARDAEFFFRHVQEVDGTRALIDLHEAAAKTDAQKAIRNNTQALRSELTKWSVAEREKLAMTISQDTFLVVVQTPDLERAYRIFTVMNSRGLELSTADLLKSKVIGSIDDAESSQYADRWESAEQDIGREDFSDLFLYLRWIFRKERPRTSMFKEYESAILPDFLPSGAKSFVDDWIMPYAEALSDLTNCNYSAPRGADAVNEWFRRLSQLDNDDWRPAALWALKSHNDDPVWLDLFLRKLERLAASMLLRRTYTTPRQQRYAELLKQLDVCGHEAPAFDLDEGEKVATRNALRQDIYTVTASRRYVLQRLDEVLADSPGVTYSHPVVSVEHVLPQNPAPYSEWVRNFTDEERAEWTHKLANLVLLSRRKNSQAGRYGFADKKRRYFSGSTGVSTFALTSQVLSETEWTPKVLSARQDELVGLLEHEWDLL
jgi:hypothetical protein